MTSEITERITRLEATIREANQVILRSQQLLSTAVDQLVEIKGEAFGKKKHDKWDHVME